MSSPVTIVIAEATSFTAVRNRVPESVSVGA